MAFFEPRFGRDLSHVRVHTDSRADTAARELEARAFAVGSSLVFARGQYDPGSARGRTLLAHELAHTLQPQRDVIHRKPLTEEEKMRDLQSAELRDDERLQQAFDNSPVLKKNETSEGVKTLQRALRDLDYQLPISFQKTGDADGIFGDETFAQVQQFQRDHGLDDMGVVDRDTLQALDDAFNPTVTIEAVFFGDDRRELVDNELGWSAAGTRYADWSGKPYHVVFESGSLLGAKAIPITVSAGKQITALAKVSIRGGIPGRTYTLKATPQEAAPGWTLSGEASHRQGFDTDYVMLTGSAPLAKKVAFHDFLMLWEAETFAGRTTTAALSHQKAFVTSGPAHNTSGTDRGDLPYVPTFRRLRQAMRFAGGVPATEADRIVYNVFRKFPNYGVCDVPTAPNSYGITCPLASSVWEMSDYVSTGNFQCITISRYVNAVLNVLGVPRALPGIVVKPVVIWANPARKEEGIDSDWPHPGINIPSIRHPRHPEWALGLLDGNCGINNYEACIKLQWHPPSEPRPIVQYYCGGLGEANPPEGFATPREVLNSAFVLAYHVRMKTNDPKTGFPRGIRKRDVKVYRESGRCHEEL
jgi:peptidoglycan hydrolase-like protein with peptidoglycan-binding domain